MCFGGMRPAGPTIVDPANRSANAAADAVQARRKNAQGFGASLGGGIVQGDQPSIVRKLMLGG